MFNRGMGTDIFNTDSGRKFLALIKAVFKVSDLISDLVIREKIKKQNLKIYENFISSGGGNNHSDLLKNIDVLRGFLFLAGQMNLIKDEHLKALENGFLFFKSHISAAPPAPAPAKIELTERQEKIMKYFQEHGQAKLAELTEFLPNFSERTIRNELSVLIGLRQIKRSGAGNGSFYEMFR